MKNNLVVYNAVLCHKVTPNDDEWEEANSYKQFDSNEQYAYIDDTYISSINYKQLKKQIDNYFQVIKNNNIYCFVSKFVFKDISKEEQESIIKEIEENGFLSIGRLEEVTYYIYDYRHVILYYVGSINNFKNITKYTD